MFTSILIIEDHPLFRDALVSLSQEVIANGQVITAMTAEEGLRVAATLPGLCLILLDISLPGMDGVQAVTAFYEAYPEAKTIVISASEDRRDVTACLCAGAKTFISKNVPRATMLETIRGILTEKLTKPEWIRPSHNGVFSDEHALPLNPRQRQILSLLARGYTNREIATQIGLAEITVKQHLTVIFRVLDVENRAQALVAIRRFGLLAGEK